MFGLKRRYSALFGLIDNLLKSVRENVSLMHDSITEKNKLVQVKKVNMFGCHQHRNNYER